MEPIHSSSQNNGCNHSKESCCHQGANLPREPQRLEPNQKQSEELGTEIALRASEQNLRHYERIVSATADGIALVDRHYRYQIVNQAYARYYGKPNTEIVGAFVGDVVGQEVFETVVQPGLEQCFRGEIVRFETWMRFPQLGDQFISITYSPYLEADQPPAYAIVSFRNITDLKRIQDQLLHQAERERALQQVVQTMRQSLDLNQVLETAVHEVRHLIQVDRALIFRFQPDWSGEVVVESVEAPWHSILGANIYDPCFTTTYVQRYQNGRVRAIENILTAGLGDCHIKLLTTFQVKANLVVPIVQGTRLWGLIIAHHCSAPRQWHSNEVDLLQQLSAQMAIAIHQSELYEQVQQWNSALEDQVQERTAQLQQALDLESLLKRITDKVRDSLDEQQILQTAVQELANGLEVYCCDTALYDLDQQITTISHEFIRDKVLSAAGQSFPFSNLPEVYGQLMQGQWMQFCLTSVPKVWSRYAEEKFSILCCPVMDDQGMLGDMWLYKPRDKSFNSLEIRLVEQVANQCAIAIRQARLYEAAQEQVSELERLNRLKDDFLSTISHELRTPMANIKMATQMLEIALSQMNLSESDLAAIEQYFGILNEEEDKEIKLINDLLDLSRLDANTEPLMISTLDLKAWILWLIEPVREQAHVQQQTIEINIPDNLPFLTTDFSYLQRIFGELLNNACKYTPAGETIAISAQPGADNTLRFDVRNTGVEIPPSERDRIFERFYRIPNIDPWKYGGTGLGLALVKKLVTQLQGTIQVRSGDNQTTFVVQLPCSLTRHPQPA